MPNEKTMIREFHFICNYTLSFYGLCRQKQKINGFLSNMSKAKTNIKLNVVSARKIQSSFLKDAKKETLTNAMGPKSFQGLPVIFFMEAFAQNIVLACLNDLMNLQTTVFSTKLQISYLLGHDDDNPKLFICLVLANQGGIIIGKENRGERV